MDTFTRSDSVREWVRGRRAARRTVALVPTAGTLHKGHMSLVAEALERADEVIVSIFATGRDAAMPTLEADRAILQKLGVHLVFAPPVQEVYPFGREHSALVALPSLADTLEGAGKPGILADTTTTLVKLFGIVRPDIAVFGERDFQRFIMIRRVVEDLFLSLNVVACATFREGDGLALATANRDFGPEERAVAPKLYATLKQLAQRIDSGERDYGALEQQGARALESAGFAPEYVAIRQVVDLMPARAGVRDLVILAAARLRAIRLTDTLRVHVIDRF